jgi:hypothetical protein
LRSAQLSQTLSKNTTNKYVQKAFKTEIQSVRNALEGTRNQALNDAAFNLGQLVGAGTFEESEVHQALQNAGHAIGLDADEIVATVNSGLEAGKRNPRDMNQVRTQPGKSSGKVRQIWSGVNGTKAIAETPKQPKTKLELSERWKWFGIENGQIVEIKKDQGRNGEAEEYTVPLCNFAARIVAETTRDDGAEVHRFFTIQGNLWNGQPLATIDVPAMHFAGLNWVNRLDTLLSTVRSNSTKEFDHAKKAITDLHQRIQNPSC